MYCIDCLVYCSPTGESTLHSLYKHSHVSWPMLYQMMVRLLASFVGRPHCPLPPLTAMSEDGLVSLQALVEGLVLEVHITGQTSSNTPPSPSTDQNPVSEDKETEGECPVMKWFHIEPAPLVELYTKFGSDVRACVNMHTCVYSIYSRPMSAFTLDLE